MLKKIINFIEKEFNKDYSFNNSLNNIKLLKEYITEEFETISYDDMLELIEKSSILSMSIKVIMKCSSHELKTTLIDLYYNDSFIFNIINAYSSLNGIIIDGWLEVKDHKTSAVSESEMLDLIKSAQAGDKEALEILLELNLGLMRKAVLKFVNKSKLEYEDLLQESRYGMIKAIYGFEPEKGYQFSTYAFKCMESVIHHAMYNDGIDVRIPQNKMEKIKKVYAVKMRLIDEFGFEPTSGMIAKECNYTIEQVEELLSVEIAKVISMNDRGFDSDDRSLEDVLPSDVNIEKDFLNKTYNEYVLKVVANFLSDIEFEVLLYRLGFIDNKEYTQEEVSIRLNLSRQRICQIEQSALKKLHSKPLLDLLKVVDTKSLGRKLNAKKGSEYLMSNMIYIREPQSLFEYFKEYTYEEVLKAVNMLRDSYKNILYNKFDHNLNAISQVKRSNTGLFINEIKPLIEEYLVTIAKKNGRKSVFVWFENSSKENIIAAVNTLTPANSAIFYKRFGIDLDELNPLMPSEREALYDTIIPYLQNYIKYKNKDSKRLFDYFEGFSEEEVINAIRLLPKEYLNIIIDKFGPKFDSNNYISIPRARLLEAKIIPKVKQIIMNLRRDKYLLEVFDTMEYNELYRALYSLKDSERELLYERYGYGLDTINSTTVTAKRNLYEKVIPKLFEIWGLDYNFNYSIENKEITFYFPNKELKDIKLAINMLDDNDRNLVYARFGDNLDCINKVDNMAVLYYDVFNKIRDNLFRIRVKSIINNAGLLTLLSEKEREDIQKAAKMICEVNSELDDLDLLIFILHNGIGVSSYRISDLVRILNKSEYYICVVLNRLAKYEKIDYLYKKLEKINRKEKQEKRLEMQKNNKKFAF